MNKIKDKTKNIFALGLLLLGFTAPAVAQNFNSQSFIAPGLAFLSVSNKWGGITNFNMITNGASGALGWTNWGGLLLGKSNALGGATSFTIAAGITYSTNPVTGVITTNGGWWTQNLLTGGAKLWTDRNGNYPQLYYTNGVVGAGIPPLLSPSGASVSITLTTTNAAANAAVNFTFYPVPDGNNIVTNAATAWTVGVTPQALGGTNTFTIFTNPPINTLWQGCAKMILGTVVNADTDADSIVLINAVRLNGFIP